MSEGSSAGSQDLDEGVGVLDFVGVLLRGGVDTLHALTLRGTGDTTLRSVDVVVETVQQTADDHGRDALEESAHVAPLIDLTRAHGVITQESHGPTQRAAALQQLLLVAGL